MKKRKRKTRHHIISISKGGTDEKSNIVLVDEREHNIFHSLYSNLLPEECIEYLVNCFWGGNWTYVRNALDKEWNKRVSS